MAFQVQNSDGTVDGANSYSDPDALKAYAQERGVDLSAQDDAALQAALIRATDFLDTAFRYVGEQRRVEQGTAWPRLGVPSRHQVGLPAALVRACHQAALRTAQGTALMPDPSGQVVSELTTKIGPIEKSTKYAVAARSSSWTAPGELAARFPEIELGLRQAGLLGGTGGGRLVRG